MLQLIPPLSMAFLLTSAAGSALWAVRLEEEAQAAEDQSRDLEPPPPYVDDPI
jgi:hypothetical protein